MRIGGQLRSQVSRRPKGGKRLRYVDPVKVKRLLGGVFPSQILAKLIDVDLVALNDEAVIRMGGRGVRPKFLPEEHRSKVLAIVDKMEKYNRKLISHPELMRDRSFILLLSI